MKENTNYLRTISEIFAATGLILSLVFVGLQIRQSTIADRAAAYQVIGTEAANWWSNLASDALLSRAWSTSMSENGWQGLSDDEKEQVRHLWISALRGRETVFLLVESGLLEAEAMDYLGFGRNWGDSYSFRVVWSTFRGSVGPNFARALEAELGLPKG